MPTPRTRPLPGMVLVLIAVPTSVWVALLVVVWVLAATDHEAPTGGFWSIGIALSVTTTLLAFGAWAFTRAKAHVSSEFAVYYDMWCHRADHQVTQPILRAVGTAMVAVTSEPAPLPDNVRSFELGRQVGRREGRDN